MAGVTNEHGLTPRQEKFCQAFIENGGNASDAYRAAFSTKNMKIETIHRRACDVIQHSKVSARIEAARSEMSARHRVTVETLVHEFEEARQKALKDPRSVSAAVQATNGKMKLFGLDKRAELQVTRDFEQEERGSEFNYLGIPAQLVGPSFIQFIHDVRNPEYDEFWLKGGRGSLKSTTVSEVLIDDLLGNPGCHAVVLREVFGTQKDSCYSQLMWAIEQLGQAELWTARKSPLELIYKPTGQTIYFRGLDDPLKLKSIKPRFGYIRDIWFEEVSEVEGGMETIRNVKQSLKRGGEHFNLFYSYNPPKSKNNWVNIAVEEERLRPNVRVYHSDYTSVPRAWLGEPFFIDAEHLKAVNEMAYRHEYLGEITGTGGSVLDNVVLEEIPEDISLEALRFGIDFGFAQDPFCWLQVGYNRLYDTLYILDEIYGLKLHDDVVAGRIKEKALASENHFGDSADPKAIDKLRNEGVNIRGCEKFNGSREHGYKFLQRWKSIVIDQRRTPNAAREFTSLEYERDKEGNFLSVIPKRNDHTIDAARYALDREIANARGRTTSTYVSMG